MRSTRAFWTWFSDSTRGQTGLKTFKRTDENTHNVFGAPTQAPGYDLKIVNASKCEYNEDDEVVRGKGVHALMGYLFLNTKNKAPGLSLEPSLLTLKKGNTRQNLLTLKYGPKNELHAFTHLLNGKEDALANELKECGYTSVGGDLNNLNIGTELVETINRNDSQISMGSNSTSSVMYDKIVIL